MNQAYDKEAFDKIKLMNKTLSIKDKIDFSQFCFIGDDSGMVVFHIPHNYFHLWRDVGKQEAYQEMKKFLENQSKDLREFLKEKTE